MVFRIGVAGIPGEIPPLRSPREPPKEFFEPLDGMTGGTTAFGGMTARGVTAVRNGRPWRMAASGTG